MTNLNAKKKKKMKNNLNAQIIKIAAAATTATEAAIMKGQTHIVLHSFYKISTAILIQDSTIRNKAE